MRFLVSLGVLLASSYLAMAYPKPYQAATVSNEHYVTAHYLVGNAAQYTIADWQDDMQRAQRAGIDAFALNIAFEDPNTPNSLATAFNAAETLTNRTIQLYLNFDYLAWGAWDASSVIHYINQYQNSSAYFHYEHKPFVSTFEGTSNIEDWTTIKTVTNCFFIPDYSSIGPTAATTYSSIIDGLASWSAWPDGPSNLTTALDSTYQSALGSKPYMMPVSPWFYTDLPAFSKNWLWHSSSLWHYRWLDTITVSPTFVQIISWNDYGESHYIGPIRPSGIVAGAELYVDSAHSHEAWAELLPYYIYAFKLGNSIVENNPFLTTGPFLISPSTATAGIEKLIYWYKPTPLTSGTWSSTTGNNPSYQTPYPPSALSPDRIWFTVLLSSPAATIRITIGSGPSQSVLASHAGISHFSVPVREGEAGSVRFEVLRNGEEIWGGVASEEIVRTAEGGRVNFNPVVGCLSSE